METKNMTEVMKSVVDSRFNNDKNFIMKMFTRKSLQLRYWDVQNQRENIGSFSIKQLFIRREEASPVILVL